MEPSPAAPSAKRRAKYLLGGVVLAASLFALLGWAMTRPGATSFYRTVSEVREMGATAGQEFRVNGDVVAGSVRRDGVVTTFAITDGANELEVTTDQPLPDAFWSDTDRVEVVATGVLDGGTFSAREVFAKCPSKFKAKA